MSEEAIKTGQKKNNYSADSIQGIGKEWSMYACVPSIVYLGEYWCTRVTSLGINEVWSINSIDELGGYCGYHPRYINEDNSVNYQKINGRGIL